MHFEHSLKIAIPAHITYETMRDELDKFVVYLPNIVSTTILERKDSGNKTYMTSKWQGRYILPDIIGEMIKVSDIAWLDRAEWFNDKHACNWNFEPFIFKDYIKINGLSLYSKDGKCTKITIKGDIEVNFLHFPLIPTLLKDKMNKQVSNILISLVKPNFITLYNGLEKYVKAKNPNL